MHNCSALIRGLCLAIILSLIPGGIACADSEAAKLIAPDFRQVVNSAKDKVFPAVVFIKCVRESLEAGRRVTADVSGSGVLINDKGLVLTNWHVVDKASEVRCLLTDGPAYDATVIGSDKDLDIGLLQLKLPADAPALPFAHLGESKVLKEGDFVMAMGAPWGLSRSVSIGIVSCTRRYLPETSEYSLWLQTDASISPGNSGGPLVNTQGEVVGINTRGMSEGGDMGFSIPSNTLKEVIEKLQKQGKIPWSWTGLQLQPLRDFQRNMYFTGDSGVIVADTEPSSPAQAAGIAPRDRILRINDQSVVGKTDEDLPDLRRMLALQPAGVPIKFEIARGDKTLTIEVTPRQKGTTEGQELDCPRWDFTVKAINQFDNPELFQHREKGVFVFGLRSPGNGQNSGLQREDIIVKIQDTEVQTLDDIKQLHEKAVKNLAAESRVVLTVLRNGNLRQIVLNFSRDYSKD